MAVTMNKDNVRSLIGSELGVSGWIRIEQARIDAFADTTEDHQFIHVDPGRAAATPFGGTIAHGFLTLSLLPRFMAELRFRQDPLPRAGEGEFPRAGAREAARRAGEGAEAVPDQAGDHGGDREREQAGAGRRMAHDGDGALSVP